MCELGKESTLETRNRESRMKLRGQEDLVRAWEAVGGSRDLTGTIDIGKIKDILVSFELRAESILQVRAPDGPQPSADLRRSASLALACCLVLPAW